MKRTNFVLLLFYVRSVNISYPYSEYNTAEYTPLTKAKETCTCTIETRESIAQMLLGKNLLLNLDPYTLSNLNQGKEKIVNNTINTSKNTTLIICTTDQITGLKVQRIRVENTFIPSNPTYKMRHKHNLPPQKSEHRFPKAKHHNLQLWHPKYHSYGHPLHVQHPRALLPTNRKLLEILSDLASLLRPVKGERG